jgi:V8-like Glu-specific endopeptidase
MRLDQRGRCGSDLLPRSSPGSSASRCSCGAFARPSHRCGVALALIRQNWTRARYDVSGCALDLHLSLRRKQAYMNRQEELVTQVQRSGWEIILFLTDGLVRVYRGRVRRGNAMKGVAAAIVLTVLAFLTCTSRAAEKADGNDHIPAPGLPGIGAHDPRIRVDLDAVPWRAVGKLQAASLNMRAWCTATLVGPSTVVTAAHCVFNHRSQRCFSPSALHFLIGFNGGRYAGHAVGNRVKVAGGYDPSRPKETIGSDWALVFLDESLGSKDRVLPIARELPEDGANVMLGGYQQDHPLVLLADTQCRIEGRFVDASGRQLLRHNCTGTRGASGAPLLIERGGKWQVVAIDVASQMGIAHSAAAVLDEASEGASNRRSVGATQENGD